MNVKVTLAVAGDQVKEDTIRIDDRKLEELTEDEVEQVIEIKIREWVDRHVSVAWETEEETEEEE